MTVRYDQAFTIERRPFIVAICYTERRVRSDVKAIVQAKLYIIHPIVEQLCTRQQQTLLDIRLSERRPRGRFPNVAATHVL
jgi:hypothetical protein